MIASTRVSDFELVIRSDVVLLLNIIETPSPFVGPATTRLARLGPLPKKLSRASLNAFSREGGQ